MLFKNLSIFVTDNEHNDLTANDLSVALGKRPFVECLASQTSTFGFIPPLEDDDRLVIEVRPQVFVMCLKREEKIMPDAVVNQMLQRKIKEIEKCNGKLYKEDIAQVKEKIQVELTARALAQQTKTFAYWDVLKGWFVVNTASLNQAERFLSILRREFSGQIDAVDEANSEQELNRHKPLQAFAFKKSVNGDVVHLLTQRTLYPQLHEEFNDFVSGDSCKLKMLDGTETITFKNKNAQSPDVINFLQQGMSVVQIAMTWNEQISFVLDEKLVVKNVVFLGLEVEDRRIKASEFIANMIITTGEVGELLNALVNAFGGLVERN